ncbi:MAG TPA: hypothetical protein VMS31_22845 [Pyrinomonadaceae bacterium]|nr:hypothetical protein [Pyrinomonadaceae bacterium]
MKTRRAVRDLIAGYDRAANVGGEGGLVLPTKYVFPFAALPGSSEGKENPLPMLERANKALQRTRNQLVSHARQFSGGGSCAPLKAAVRRLR